MPEYSEFRCANCESLIAGTPYKACCPVGPWKRGLGEPVAHAEPYNILDFCNSKCFEAFKQKGREIPHA
jgi:hypothetical protein